LGHMGRAGAKNLLAVLALFLLEARFVISRDLTESWAVPNQEDKAAVVPPPESVGTRPKCAIKCYSGMHLHTSKRCWRGFVASNTR
jgi:hypothetical protein